MPTEIEQERIASTLSGPIAHSPTGEAPLPQWVVRLGLATVTTAGVLQVAVPPGSQWEVGCRVVIALGAAFGIASQGVRK